MTKKEYLQILLEKLSNHWDFAKGLNIFLQKSEIDDIIINKLYYFFSEKLKSINDEEEKNKYINRIIYLDKIKSMEIDDITAEDELDNLISKI